MTLTKTTKQILIAIVVAGVIIGSWAVWYVFFKPHRDVGSEKPAYTMTTEQLNKAFDDDANAMATYIDQAILVEGVVTEVDSHHISLGNIVCNFDEANLVPEGSVSVGQTIKVQGRLTTYNDIMDELVLDKCVIK
ncbi:MAG TPA: hypothetical protein VK907_11815 [Phnomibacter sp.]|nr:hypothetical protein [Phnomibacter sp.]